MLNSSINSFATQPPQINKPIEPLYPTADLSMRWYTLVAPKGWREIEVHANRAAIAPLLRMGWKILAVRTEVRE